jgi:multimeric flavodoxin WrbA
MPVLLVVHHTTSPATAELLEAVLDGLRQEGLESVEVALRPALAATAVDVLAADAFVLLTPANIGYMSGAMKHFFDQIYYPCLTAKLGAGYGFVVHGNNDTDGAGRAIDSIAKGLGWRQVAAPVSVIGAPGKAERQRCADLAATVAATLL